MPTEPDYALPPAPRASLALSGSAQRFAVNRIFCIGRNYAAHAVEMGHDPTREPPFFFLKPASALSVDGRFSYPAMSSDVHHEVEMIVALGKGGTDIAVDAALDHVFGYGVGLDMTCRDLQSEAKALSRPWDIAKGFDQSAPCSALATARDIGHPDSGAITLSVNGEPRQIGDLNQMIWKVPEIIATLSRAFALLPGDVIMTGTPAGVGPVARGDRLVARVEGIAELDVAVV
ncbi:fumarylacetoacetate hydrolase family protein [Pelagibacterium lacus]|uniref:FAA hydrolase family protein n=1 Tax=Pelagibacterium lacus TaxID=2282655 RepID=A0A369W6T0_9HYPH|nr:fumarylacetoacetate hydrolase family protein [Pelagibacterium lacus]RDE07781.1 FAA hydrolase family protein [Pelagibacterium lacus]